MIIESEENMKKADDYNKLYNTSICFGPWVAALELSENEVPDRGHSIEKMEWLIRSWAKEERPHHTAVDFDEEKKKISIFTDDKEEIIDEDYYNKILNEG